MSRISLLGAAQLSEPGFQGYFKLTWETGCSAAGLRSFVPFLLAGWICVDRVSIALVLDPMAEGQQVQRAGALCWLLRDQTG